MPRSSRIRQLLVVAAMLGVATSASALTVPLNIEFDNGTVGTYATVDVTENAGDLDFSISLAGTTLGANADLHEFYFNLLGSFTGVTISDTNAPNTAYTLDDAPTVAGGAGASFDWGVNFGDGAGPPGNGALKLATFTISANEALTLAALAETSSTSGSGVTVNFAAHVQGTSLPGATSETVGGVIPEPATLSLVAAGLGALSLVRRRRSSPRRR